MGVYVPYQYKQCTGNFGVCSLLNMQNCASDSPIPKAFRPRSPRVIVIVHSSCQGNRLDKSICHFGCSWSPGTFTTGRRGPSMPAFPTKDRIQLKGSLVLLSRILASSRNKVLISWSFIIPSRGSGFILFFEPLSLWSLSLQYMAAQRKGGDANPVSRPLLSPPLSRSSLVQPTQPTAPHPPWR